MGESTEQGVQEHHHTYYIIGLRHTSWSNHAISIFGMSVTRTAIIARSARYINLMHLLDLTVILFLSNLKSAIDEMSGVGNI